MQLTFNTFCNHYILEPFQCSDKKDRLIALVGSIAVGILFLGLFQCVLYLRQKCKDQSLSQRQISLNGIEKFKKNQETCYRVLTAKVIKKLKGYNLSYQLELPNKKMIFWKHSNENINREVSASKLASYVTDGLVPKARMATYKGKTGIISDFFNLDTKPFENLLKMKSINFNFLNTQQIHQLFCHVIMDRLISNWDTHQGQYGIDLLNRNVISFDKGLSFRLFDLDGLKAENINELDLTIDYWLTDETVSKKDCMGAKLYARVASTFAKAVLNKEITIDITNPILQSFFDKCKNISYSKVEKYLNPLAREMYPSRQSEFINFVWRRVKDVERKTFQYFGW